MTNRKKISMLKKLRRIIQQNMEGTDGLQVLEWEDGPVLSWEEGPFEWAPCLTGGSALWAAEIGNYSLENPWYEKIEALMLAHGVYFECRNNFQITVWED